MNFRNLLTNHFSRNLAASFSQKNGNISKKSENTFYTFTPEVQNKEISVDLFCFRILKSINLKRQPKKWSRICFKKLIH